VARVIRISPRGLDAALPEHGGQPIGHDRGQQEERHEPQDQRHEAEQRAAMFVGPEGVTSPSIGEKDENASRVTTYTSLRTKTRRRVRTTTPERGAPPPARPAAQPDAGPTLPAAKDLSLGSHGTGEGVHLGRSKGTARRGSTTLEPVTLLVWGAPAPLLAGNIGRVLVRGGAARHSAPRSRPARAARMAVGAPPPPGPSADSAPPCSPCAVRARCPFAGAHRTRG
jgi:hypothetical protein